jgi:alpha-tubulin suppressor-like RCC1 family protein
MALKNDGTLWTWGNGSYGCLGDLQDSDRSSPVMIANGKTWKSIGGSNYYWGCSAAIDDNDHIFVWGLNDHGQLGLEDQNDRSSPIQMGGKTWSQVSSSAYSMGAIDTDGKLWMWGDGGYGALGLNSTVDYSSPVQVGADTDWMQIACGYHYTMAIKNDGTLWAWGEGSDGKLGLGNQNDYSSPTQVGSDTNWNKVATCNDHSAAIKEDGSLFIWGRNNHGQLGQGNQINTSSPVQVSGTWTDITCGEYHTAAIKNSTLWTWGENGDGQLGDGTEIDKSSPVQTLMNFSGWTSVSAGYATVCLITYSTEVIKSCSSKACTTPAFKCYVGTTSSCTCAKWRLFSAGCTRIQASLGICSGTSSAYVPAITVCNLRLF